MFNSYRLLRREIVVVPMLLQGTRAERDMLKILR